MNYPMLARILSRVMLLEAVLMAPPVLVALIYGESALSFLVTAALCLALGGLLALLKPKRTDLYAREGFVGVALSWVLMSLVGGLPFCISGQIPSYVDAVFEIVSGFTTTGASIVTNAESLSRGMLFWRSLSQWIGGMGVLVFIMAVLPLSEEHSMHIMRAEVPGPVVGKLVPRMRRSSAITYAIYVALTVLLIILLCGGGMPLYDSFIHAMSAASTGGFSCRALSVGFYNSAYIDVVTGIFMLLFGVNFSVYFLLLVGKFKTALTNTEFLTYFGIVAFAVITIAFNINGLYDSAGQALRYSFFQVSTVITTTGFATADFNLWPAYSKCLLVLLMFIGASAGSTGGGIKVSRCIILAKAAKRELSRMLNPRKYEPVRMDGQRVDNETVRCTLVFFALYVVITFVTTLIVSCDGFDLETNFTAVVACISNIGPGLGLVGPTGSFAMFSDLSKVLLTINMLVGRLEVYPILILMLPSTWRKN